MRFPCIFGKSQTLKKGNRSLQKCCEDLKTRHGISEDPITYLGHTFKNPAALLSVMFDTGSIISGSRALEFFVKGSTGEASDWDFYIPAFKDAIVDIIKILNECCEVEWKSAADFMPKDRKTISPRLIANLETRSNKANKLNKLNARKDLLGDDLNSIIRAYNDGSIPTDNTMNQSNEEMESYDFVGLPFPIMEGTIKSGSKKNIKIQLIIASWSDFGTSLLRFIGRFYASHVQCFIGGWYAYHMYYDMAKNRRAYQWLPNNMQTGKKTQEAIEKYKERRYEFIKPQAREKINSLTDGNEGESKFIDFWDMYDCIVPCATKKYGRHYRERKEQLGGVRWAEVHGKLKLHPSDRQVPMYYNEILRRSREKAKAEKAAEEAINAAKEAKMAAKEAKMAAKHGDEEVKKAAEAAKKAAEEAKEAVKEAKEAVKEAKEAVKEAKEAVKEAKEAVKKAKEAFKRVEPAMDAPSKIMRQRLANDVAKALKVSGFQSSIEHGAKWGRDTENILDWGIPELAKSGRSASTFHTTTPWSWSF